jgi:hypothetical protein
MKFFSSNIIPFFIILIAKLYICDEVKGHKFIVANISTKYPEVGEQNYFYDHYIDNDLFTKIKLGSDEQNVEMKIELNSYETYIVKESFVNKTAFTPFNTNTSTTFKTLTRFFNQKGDFSTALLSNDSLVVNNGKEDIKLNNFYFAYVDQSYIKYPGSIGFNLLFGVSFPEESMNFIDQLKNNSIISGYSLTIIFDTNYQGQLIIGPDMEDILPYEIDKATRHSVYVDKPTYNNDGKWILKFDKVLVGTSELLYSKETNFNLKYDFIISTDEYTEFIFKNFFSSLFGSNQCIKEVNKLFQYYYGVKCNKNVNIKNFPDLKFNIATKSEQFSLVLDYDDLFEEVGEYKYFKIILTNKTTETSTINNEWILGKYFFKKYLVTFNKDRNNINIYVTEKQKKEEESDNSNSNLNEISNYEKWLWILVVVLLIMAGVIAYLLIKCIKQGKIIKKKSRLNILDDEMRDDIN